VLVKAIRSQRNGIAMRQTRVSGWHSLSSGGYMTLDGEFLKTMKKP